MLKEQSSGAFVQASFVKNKISRQTVSGGNPLLHAIPDLRSVNCG